MSAGSGSLPCRGLGTGLGWVRDVRGIFAALVLVVPRRLIVETPLPPGDTLAVIQAVSGG